MIKDSLSAILQAKGAGPFLFVGSGFSRRYLGLEDWRGLLSRFCVAGQPFEYYLATANGDMPAAARLLAEHFNKYWWTAEEFRSNTERYKDKIVNASSALRLEISAYLTSLDQSVAMTSEFADEVKLLSTLNVDGVITTNWDMFLEHIFPDYKVYVGQEELLFSNPQEIGEIYKIHGSSHIPESLVLTDDDYRQFNDKNAYLAAKLITLFVEHPIVFIGYSISDSNVTSLLRAISLCIGRDNVEQLRQNLIFVQRPSANEPDSISDTYLTIDGVQIPLVLVLTSDFAAVYQAIDVTKRKIPARVLRFCKEQLCELVKSSEPEKKLCVVDIDEIEKQEGVEFLVGVGVVSEHEPPISETGYVQIESKDLFSDLLHENRGYNASQILEHVIKVAGRNTKNIPVFKYLHEHGITSAIEYDQSDIALDKWVNRDIKDFRMRTYTAPFRRHHRHQSSAEIIAACTPENAAAYIPFLSTDRIDLDALKEFLIENEEKMDYLQSSYASSFRKLACLYDRLKWGW